MEEKKTCRKKFERHSNEKVEIKDIKTPKHSKTTVTAVIDNLLEVEKKPKIVKVGEIGSPEDGKSAIDGAVNLVQKMIETENKYEEDEKTI